MDGNALAVALALLQTPSLRITLRAQPLPDGIDQLIVLAAGTAPALAAAAARSGVAPDRVLEAARFYVREILLFPEADAYRVLGVSASASDAQIKLHYRHLQHWLHPDRRGDDWESVFAARINRAWNELRTASRRAAYDARAMSHAVPRQRVLVNDWRPTAATATGNWRGRGLLGAAFACCLWLAWLALRQFNAPAPQWQATPPPLPMATRDAQQPGHAVVQAGAGPGTGVGTRSAGAAGVASPMPVPSLAHLPGVPAASREVAEPRGVPSVLALREPGQEVPAVGETSMPEASPLAMTTPAAAGMPAAMPAPPVTSQPSADQLQLVQHRGRDLTRYLASPAVPTPPIWRTAAAQDAAASLRGQLLEAGRKAHFGQPDWRIADDRASMTVLVHRNELTEPALALHAEFSWRDGLWLVDRVETERLR